MRLNGIYIALILLVGILLFEACQGGDFEEPLPDTVDFNFDIRPILSNNCFLCHGPDSSSRKANLRLDLESTATAELENGARPIHPGNWKKSEIIQRITSDDPDMMMPPPEMNKKLSKREVALLKKWIDQGAEWKEYWAFIPPKSEIGKESNLDKNISQKIDIFIDKGIKGKGLKSADKAEKTALIRRLAILLTGLPPTIEEIDAFLNDQGSNAYEKIVDQYLNSPHFGERWARHWMDLMRYAEYQGHEFDYPIVNAWQYRDYLIRAFNEDMPYNQFIIEHLAGDLLEEPRIHPEKQTNESAIGPTYLTLGEAKHSPVDIKQEEADRIDNMIDVTTKTFQGLTVACSRCHDHKFDPIPTTDYYSLYGIFESTRYALIPANTSIKAPERIDSIEQIKQQLRTLIANDLRNTNISNLSSISSFKELGYKKVLTNNNYVPQSDLIVDFRNGSLNGWFSNGMAFNNQNAIGEPVFESESGKFSHLESGKASSKVLGKGIQGALRSPTFTIDKNKLLVRASGEESMIRIVVENFQLIQNPIYGSLQNWVEGAEMRDYIFDLQMVLGRKAYIELLPGKMVNIDGKLHYFEFDENAWIEAEYAFLYEGEDIPSPPELPSFKVESPEKALSNWQNQKANPAEIKLINELLNHKNSSFNNPKLPPLIDNWDNLANNLRDSTFFQGMVEGDAQLSPVFIRGSLKTLSEEKVPHQFFDALQKFSPEFPQTGSGRLAYAKAIASKENPLTARVMVNRIWHHLFGRGIVETVDNFGLQGKAPTHPELLDYLAIQFMDDEWSIKKLIRHIVLSNAFQRSTKSSEATNIKDPQNLYLSHFPIRRLEGEAIRDAVLAVSGRLDKQLCGEPFEIYLTNFIKGRGRPRNSGALDGEGRRSIYQAIRRNFLPPFMLTFDMPVPFTAFGKRNVSNVPAQSLALMNDPFILQQAERWSQEIIKNQNSFDERINHIYQKAFARAPKPEEIETAKEFFKEQALIHNLEEVEQPNDPKLWADYCHSIFMMKEFVFLTN